MHVTDCPQSEAQVEKTALFLPQDLRVRAEHHRMLLCCVRLLRRVDAGRCVWHHLEGSVRRGSSIVVSRKWPR